MNNRKLQMIIEELEKIEKKQTIYICRPLVNHEEFKEWATSQGFKTTLPPDQLHATLAFSKKPIDWSLITPETNQLVSSNNQDRHVEVLGDKGAIVLRFEDAALTKRWEEICAVGAEWKHDGYRPHVTITYDASGVDLDAVKPYDGDLVFGPEKFAEVDEDWADKIKEK